MEWIPHVGGQALRMEGCMTVGDAIGIAEADRLTPEQIAELYERGAVLIPDFLRAEEIAEARQDILAMFESVATQAGRNSVPLGPDVREFARDSWFDYCDFPYDSRALSLVGCHPSILAVARRVLQSEEVMMHYNYATAKFTGYKNYSQPLHLDSPMHSFFAPSNVPKYSVINCVIYLSDVDACCGALSYVPLPETRLVPYGKITLDEKENLRLSEREVSTEGRAGSLLVYFHHTYHRGTNLLGAGCSRYQVVVSYHAKEASAFVGGTMWPSRALTVDWQHFLPYASIEQLCTIGIPKPGHDFWTHAILDDLKRRFPGWDLSEYRRGVISE